MGLGRASGVIISDTDHLVLKKQKSSHEPTFGYKSIAITSFYLIRTFRIMPGMSIRNVKIDLLSAAAIGAFALFVFAPILA